MRARINENPLFQAVLIGVLVIVFAVVVMRQMGGGEEETADPASAATETAAPVATDPAASADVAATDPSAVAPADATALAPPATGVAVPQAVAFEAGPGLPKDVVRAHERGDTIVLLAYRSNGVDDRAMKRVVRTLDAPDVALFETNIRGLPRYSRIATGLRVDRAPAMIVIRPKRFDQGGMPRASVAYGLQSLTAAAQAVRDADYRGSETLPYHPR